MAVIKADMRISVAHALSVPRRHSCRRLILVAPMSAVCRLLSVGERRAKLARTGRSPRPNVGTPDGKSACATAGATP
jgi:hypothetical protein